MPLPLLTDLPDAPSPSDSEEQFDIKAYAFTLALPPMVIEMREFGTALEVLQSNVALNAVAANLADVDFATIPNQVLKINAAGNAVEGVAVNANPDLSVGPDEIPTRGALAGSQQTSGVFTPTLVDSSGNSYDAVSVQGDYVRTGRQVSIWLRAGGPAGATTKPAGAQAVFVGGLPFAGNGAAFRKPFPVNWDAGATVLPSTIFADVGTNGGIISAIGNYLALHNSNNPDGSDPLRFSDLPPAGETFQLYLFATYITDD